MCRRVLWHCAGAQHDCHLLPLAGRRALWLHHGGHPALVLHRLPALPGRHGHWPQLEQHARSPLQVPDVPGSSVARGAAHPPPTATRRRCRSLLGPARRCQEAACSLSSGGGAGSGWLGSDGEVCVPPVAWRRACRVKRIPSPIPDRVWYLQPWAITLVGGLLPFGSIFIEMYFIFTSFWNYKVSAAFCWASPPPSGRLALGVAGRAHSATPGTQGCCFVAKGGRERDTTCAPTCLPACVQVYYVYGFMLLVVVILMIVTVCVTIVGTYFLLNAENYHWCVPALALSLSLPLSLARARAQCNSLRSTAAGRAWPARTARARRRGGAAVGVPRVELSPRERRAPLPATTGRPQAVDVVWHERLDGAVRAALLGALLFVQDQDDRCGGGLGVWLRRRAKRSGALFSPHLPHALLACGLQRAPPCRRHR